MAELYIREYTRLARDIDGNVIQAGEEPAEASQVVSFTATAGQSIATGSATKFVRIESNADGFIDLGIDPTAVALAGIPVKANQPEYFGVRRGTKISAVE